MARPMRRKPTPSRRCSGSSSRALCADLAHGAAGDVRHAHPGAADRAQRQRQSPALGLAAGCRLAARGGLAVRGARGGTAARRGARGCGRTCRHGPHGTRKPRGTHASHALQDAIGLRNSALRPPSAERGIRRPGSSAISAGQQMQCRSPVPRWDCVWRGLRRRLRTARRRRRPELPAATGHRPTGPPAISDDGNSRPRAGGALRPTGSLLAGHECQREAPACWPATLLRGGVLRVTTGPPAPAGGKRGPGAPGPPDPGESLCRSPPSAQTAPRKPRPRWPAAPWSGQPTQARVGAVPSRPTSTCGPSGRWTLSPARSRPWSRRTSGCPRCTGPSWTTPTSTTRRRRRPWSR